MSSELHPLPSFPFTVAPRPSPPPPRNDTHSNKLVDPLLLLEQLIGI
jgi:hypothetical protein